MLAVICSETLPEKKSRRGRILSNITIGMDNANIVRKISRFERRAMELQREQKTADPGRKGELIARMEFYQRMAERMKGRITS